MKNIVSQLRLYLCHLHDPNKSRYDPLLCLRRDSQDVEFGMQNINKAITICKVFAEKIR